MSRRARRGQLIVATLLAALLLAGPVSAAPPETKALAPAWEPLRYPAPDPGTYELSPLGDAVDGEVLDTDGRRLRLFDLLGDRIAVLSFIYTACPDVNACPMATYVLTGVQRRMREDARLGDQVRLISLSFDPEHDSPEAMRAYSQHVRQDGGDWRFLTTSSKQALDPILAGYGQSVRREVDSEGRPLRTISHILRVFLIDRQKRIRNIYTTSFLHADTLWSDIQTLALDAADGEPIEARATSTKTAAAVAGSTALGLPAAPKATDDSRTPARIALGRKLFFDRRLSLNQTISCAMCHVPSQGFTSNEMATAVGIEGQTVRRNAPTLYNVAYLERLMHDGRENRLEQQIWSPLLAENEMGNRSVGQVLERVSSLPEYGPLFVEAFDASGPTMETLGQALASYERTLVSGGSSFDRWRFGGESEALSPAAQRGFALFTGKAGCAACHTISQDHALFTDQRYHNTGVGYRRSMKPLAGVRPLELAPGDVRPVDLAVLASAAERPANDLGRYEITLDPADRWKYRTPSLRNVALTAPYMHDGSIPTLREVVEFYDAGGVPNETLDPGVRQLGLGAGEIDDLVAFLESLTGANIDATVAAAEAEPIGDPVTRPAGGDQP